MVKCMWGRPVIYQRDGEIRRYDNSKKDYNTHIQL